MERLHVLRQRLALLLITALLLQSFAPISLARLQRSAGDGLPWSDVCTSSGQSSGPSARVDGHEAVPREDVRLPHTHGDHHCPSCVTSFGGMPATVAGARRAAPSAPEGWVDGSPAPDRVSTWSAQQTRGPPATS